MLAIREFEHRRSTLMYLFMKASRVVLRGAKVTRGTIDLLRF